MIHAESNLNVGLALRGGIARGARVAPQPAVSTRHLIRPNPDDRTRQIIPRCVVKTLVLIIQIIISHDSKVVIFG